MARFDLLLVIFLSLLVLARCQNSTNATTPAAAPAGATAGAASPTLSISDHCLNLFKLGPWAVTQGALELAQAGKGMVQAWFG